MKVETMNIPAAGTWARDCELMSFIVKNGFELSYHKDDDNTYWKMQAEGIAAYKVTTEELAMAGYLSDLPIEGAFYEIQGSPWMKEFEELDCHFLPPCKHYVLPFYDETIEIIAREISFERLPDRPGGI